MNIFNKQSTEGQQTVSTLSAQCDETSHNPTNANRIALYGCGHGAGHDDDNTTSLDDAVEDGGLKSALSELDDVGRERVGASDPRTR